MLDKIRESSGAALSVSADDIHEDTTINDVKMWDSLNHLALVIELEKKFSIKFKPNEMLALDSVSKIIEVLKGKGVE